MFDESWAGNIDKFQRDILPRELIRSEKINPWIEYLFNEEDPPSSRYRCGICFRYHSKVHENVYLPEIAKENGTLLRTIQYNRKALNRHVENPIHKKVLEYVMKMLDGDYDLDSYSILTETAALANNINWMVKEDISLKKINSLEKLQAKNSRLRLQAHTEVRHPFSRVSQMINTMSNDFHKKLIEAINTRDSPISILIDTTTTNMNDHVLVIFFTHVTDNKLKISFYKLINVGSVEDAEAQYQLLLNNFEEDGISDSIHHLLVALIADGASVYSGKNNSVSVKFDEWVQENGRHILKIWCSAHRYMIALKRSYRQFKPFIRLKFS